MFRLAKQENVTQKDDRSRRGLTWGRRDDDAESQRPHGFGKHNWRESREYCSLYVHSCRWYSVRQSTHKNRRRELSVRPPVTQVSPARSAVYSFLSLSLTLPARTCTTTTTLALLQLFSLFFFFLFPFSYILFFLFFSLTLPSLSLTVFFPIALMMTRGATQFIATLGI